MHLYSMLSLIQILPKNNFRFFKKYQDLVNMIVLYNFPFVFTSNSQFFLESRQKIILRYEKLLTYNYHIYNYHLHLTANDLPSRSSLSNSFVIQHTQLPHQDGQSQVYCIQLFKGDLTSSMNVNGDRTSKKTIKLQKCLKQYIPLQPSKKYIRCTNSIFHYKVRCSV